jgi:hypothetical protein
MCKNYSKGLVIKMLQLFFVRSFILMVIVVIGLESFLIGIVNQLQYKKVMKIKKMKNNVLIFNFYN